MLGGELPPPPARAVSEVVAESKTAENKTVAVTAKNWSMRIIMISLFCLYFEPYKHNDPACATDSENRRVAVSREI
jgi:hypothetical protein